jgi:hypothetical protein
VSPKGSTRRSDICGYAELREGWGLVLACSGLMTISSGVWYTASVFFVELIKEFGWD